MKEKTKEELLDELNSSSLQELLELIYIYANAPEERRFVKEFILENFGEKQSYKYSKSIQNIPNCFDEKTKSKIDSARVCAREIIDHIDFDGINSLENIKDIVSLQIKITEAFSKGAQKRK